MNCNPLHDRIVNDPYFDEFLNYLGYILSLNDMIILWKNYMLLPICILLGMVVVVHTYTNVKIVVGLLRDYYNEMYPEPVYIPPPIYCK